MPQQALFRNLTNTLPSKKVANMGRKGVHNNQNHPSVPPVTPSVTSNNSTRNSTILGTMENTLRRGNLLGIERPIWLKVQESESRIEFLKEMIRRKLVVRDIESYAKSISCKLRSEGLKLREEEREILLGLMNLKLKDEKINLRVLLKKKEERKRELRNELGKSRQYEWLLKKLYKEANKRKVQLKRKYKEKIEHLERVRRHEREALLESRGVPEELRQFADCKVFDKGKMRQMTEAEVRCLVIGGISIDDDESSILKLSPKFAVMSRLDDEEMETDIEVSLAKTRYEISRQEEQQQLEVLEESSVKRRKLVGN